MYGQRVEKRNRWFERVRVRSTYDSSEKQAFHFLNRPDRVRVPAYPVPQEYELLKKKQSADNSPSEWCVGTSIQIQIQNKLSGETAYCSTGVPAHSLAMGVYTELCGHTREHDSLSGNSRWY
jgi:hypothetical protein